MFYLNPFILQVIPENSWLAEAFQNENDCNLPGWDHIDGSSTHAVHARSCLGVRKKKESDLTQLMRTRNVIASLHGLFGVVNAVKNSWKVKCHNR